MSEISQKTIRLITGDFECTVKQLTHCFKLLEADPTEVDLADIDSRIYEFAKCFTNGKGGFIQPCGNNFSKDELTELELVRCAFLLRSKPKGLGIYSSSDHWIKRNRHTRYGIIALSQLYEVNELFNPVRPKLLKFDIHQEVQDAYPQFSKQTINRALRMYVYGTRYQRLDIFGPRYGLDGKEVEYTDKVCSLDEIVKPEDKDVGDNEDSPMPFLAVTKCSSGKFNLVGSSAKTFNLLMQQGETQYQVRVYN